MNNFLPTKEQCDLICDQNKSFFAKKFIQEGQEVIVYNYFLAQAKDFKAPLLNHPEISAEELRGLTFVKEENSWKRYVMLSKFFNLNQTDGWMESDIRKQKILKVQDKLDGSMIRFISFKNGKVLAKTKQGFNNEQSKLAQSYFDANSSFQNFVKETLDKGLAAIFELCSLYNQIVIEYPKTELILIQLREESTGKYLDIYNNELVKNHQIKCCESDPINNLDWYIDQAKTLKNKEGWVFQTDTLLFKLKTEWYFNLHGVLTESLTRENQIIELVLNEKLDDAFQHLKKDDVRRTFAESVQKEIVSYMMKTKEDAVSLYKEFNEKFNENRKDFAIANKQNPLFPYSVLMIDYSNGEDLILKNIKKKLLSLNLFDAKEFLKSLGLVAPKGAFFVNDDE